jgi:YL1 nuclear protein
LNIKSREKRVTAGLRYKKPVNEDDQFWGSEVHKTWEEEQDDSSVTSLSSMSDSSISSSEDQVNDGNSSDDGTDDGDDNDGKKRNRRTAATGGYDYKKAAVLRSSRSKFQAPFKLEYGKTQAQLLKEAAETEKINTAMLAEYFRAEEEKEVVRKAVSSVVKDPIVKTERQKINDQGEFEWELRFFTDAARKEYFEDASKKPVVAQKKVKKEETAQSRNGERYKDPVSGKYFNSVVEFQNLRKLLIQDEARDFTDAVNLLKQRLIQQHAASIRTPMQQYPMPHQHQPMPYATSQQHVHPGQPVQRAPGIPLQQPQRYSNPMQHPVHTQQPPQQVHSPPQPPHPPHPPSPAVHVHPQPPYLPPSNPPTQLPINPSVVNSVVGGYPLHVQPKNLPK